MTVYCNTCLYELEPYTSEHCDSCCGNHSNYTPKFYPSQLRKLYCDYTEYARNKVTVFKRLSDVVNISEKELTKAFSSERYYRAFCKKYFGVDIGKPPYEMR